VLKIEMSYRAILIIALLALAVWLWLKLWTIILLLAVAFIFMAALLPYVEWLVQRRVPRTASVLLLLFAILAVIAGLSALVVPAMIDEFTDLRDNLPEYARDLEVFLDNFGIEVELEERARNVDWDEIISGQAAVDYGQRIAFTVLAIFSVTVLTAYLLVDSPRLSRLIYQFVPPGREPELERFLQALSRVVGGYIRGQLLTSLSIAIFTLVVLLAVGVPNPVAFAVLAGFVDIIPIIGAVIATILPTVAAFQESPTQAIIVLACMILYQQFEDRFLVPRVYGQTLNLSQMVVLIAVLAGGQLLGITGVLLALPAVATGRVVIEYILEKRQELVTPPGPTGEPLAPDTDTKEEESGK